MLQYHHTRNRLFYSIKPFIPRFFQIALRRQIAKYIRRRNNTKWPIDPEAAFKPEGWKGWPKGKNFALVLSHDVDSIKGYKNALKLASLESELGFQSIFNFVPERYGEISPLLIERLRQDGFEIGLHGLKHDGKLFATKAIFNSRVPRLNAYLRKWQTNWFTSPSMHRNLRWLTALNIKYAVSTFDTDPFEPDPRGIKTIFPFWVKNPMTQRGYLEIPYTLPQDSTLFIILKEKTNQIWKTKLDWIAKQGGLALLNTHPDYMNFDQVRTGFLEYPVEFYLDFLRYVKEIYSDQCFHSNPSSVADFISQNIDKASCLGEFSPINDSYPKSENHRACYTSDHLNLASTKDFNNKQQDHILFIVENNTVPPDIRVWREATALRKEGYSVSIISPKLGGFNKSFEIYDGIAIYRHPNIAEHPGLIGKFAEYLNAFLWEAILAFKIFIRKPFKVIHAANPPDNIFLIAIIFKIVGVKFIFDHHDICPELFTSKYSRSNKFFFYLLRIFEKLSCKTADVIISTNDSYYSHIIKHHSINPTKISVVRNDPEPDMFPEPIFKTTNIATQLFYVGSINSQDGVDHIVRAIDFLTKSLSQQNIKCTIIGDGDALDDVKTLAIKLNLMKYIEFHGYVFNRNLVKSYMANSDICLESAPGNDANRISTFIKVMEYMACGKPIIAYDLPETRYSTHACALLVSPGDYRAFAVAINELINNPQKREYLGKLGRKRIVNGLNWNTSAKVLIQTYRKILSPSFH